MYVDHLEKPLKNTDLFDFKVRLEGKAWSTTFEGMTQPLRMQEKWVRTNQAQDGRRFHFRETLTLLIHLLHSL